MRTDGRLFDQLRQIKITPHVSEYAEGSALVEFGRTKKFCAQLPMNPKLRNG